MLNDDLYSRSTHQPSARRFQVSFGKELHLSLPVINKQEDQHFISPARFTDHRDFGSLGMPGYELFLKT